MYDTISMSICKEINCKEELNLKINGVGLTSSTISHTGPGSSKVRKSTGGSFSDNLGGFERENEKEQLEKQLKEIAEKGKFVREKMELRDLIEYKSMIKEFLEHTVRFSYKYSKESKFGRDGSYKIMGIVKKVDEELESLTQEMMNSEKDRLKIVEKISGLQGMLVDLLM